MGIMTDNLQQINKSIQTQTEQKMYKKDCKENYEIYLFPIIWNKYAEDKNPEKTYTYFKNPKTIANYIQLTEISKESNFIKTTIYFNELTLADKTKIYNNLLQLIHKQFKTLIVETIPEEEQPKEEENKTEKTINNIIDILLYGLIGLTIPTNTNAKRYKKYKL